jgi:glycolate oxidase FAD binding subunit
MSTAGLAGVELYEPGALTLVVRAGTPLAEIEALLAAERQRLPFEPMDHRTLLGTEGAPTIGGVAAANVSGPRRVQVGAARDFMLGVRFVDGTGTVVRNGGRVMKNVTGYDLVKLMAGSRGTLGVLTEVAFKVLPATDAAATLTVGCEDVGRAVEAMAAALGSPYEVSGAAHDPALGTVIRIEGFEASVACRANRLAALLARFGTVAVERAPDAFAGTWRAVRDVLPFAGTAEDVWRIAACQTRGDVFTDAMTNHRLRTHAPLA